MSSLAELSAIRVETSSDWPVGRTALDPQVIAVNKLGDARKAAADRVVFGGETESGQFWRHPGPANGLKR